MLNKKKCIKAAVTIGISATLFFSNAAMAASPLLKYGSRGDDVARLQQKLKESGFYTYSKVTGYYGPITRDSVIRFQKDRGLVPDGIAGKNTFAALYGTYESGGSSLGSHLLRRGSRGQDVKELQSILKTKGLYSKSIDGIFGSGTENGVRGFQKSVGIKVDGIVGPVTISRLKDNSQSSDSSRGDSERSVELLSWSQASQLFPRKSTACVTDVDTGRSFNIYRYGGTLHADVEPLTANDTAIMKGIYGGAWSWSRRAIIVEVAGKRIAASMNGMPHGGQDIRGNNFNGQFCIHFLGSRTHGSNRVDPAHQAMVQKAATK
jgi:peptidoglycan hydrolase-like protein with peptidoglycan-binding domain